MSSIEFVVKDFPPAYDSGFSILNPRHPRHSLVQKIQSVAREAMKGKKLLISDIALKVQQEIFIGDRRTDVVNFVGGIANALEGIVYITDNQIKEIHYKQVMSERDIYKVRVKELV